MLSNKNLVKIKVNNKNFCIYKYNIGKTNLENCNYIYLYNNKGFILPENFESINLIIQKENKKIDDEYQEEVYDDWIDLETINYEKMLILKINDNRYDIFDIEISN